MTEELKVIADFYDFMLWMIRHTEKFPRHHRYSLGLAVANRLQSILGLLLRAKYTRDKGPILSEANMYVVRPDGSGRLGAEGAIRSLLMKCREAA